MLQEEGKEGFWKLCLGEEKKTVSKVGGEGDRMFWFLGGSSPSLDLPFKRKGLVFFGPNSWGTFQREYLNFWDYWIVKKNNMLIKTYERRNQKKVVVKPHKKVKQKGVGMTSLLS